jgi:hypothetical protein
MSESWWLKVERAEHHLKDIDAMMRPYEGSHPYEAERVPQPNGQRHIWRYVLRVTDQPDPKLAVLIGDFVHNLRSALDHIAVAIAPPQRWKSAGFPICFEDIWGTLSDGSFVSRDEQARKRFSSLTDGMSAGAITLIKRLQPYSNPPEDVMAHPVGVLSRLENADKHRSLIALGSGVEDGTTVVTARGYTLEQDAFGFRHDGAEVAKFAPTGPDMVDLEESEVNVDVRGPTVIAIRIGRGQDVANYNARATLGGPRAGILDAVRDALQGLEDFLPPA